MGCCDDCCELPKESREPIRYDPNFNGPIHNRSCTDIVWLLVFLIFLGGWGYLGYYSYKNGKVEQLLAPLDSNSKHCGIDEEVKDKPYLVFFNILECLNPNTAFTGCNTTQVCVKQCPKETIRFDERLESDFENVKAKMICKGSIDTAKLTYTNAKKYLEDGTCAKVVLKSQQVLFRCIGDLSTLPCGKTQSTMGSSSVISQTENSGESCSRRPKTDQVTLLNRVSALDSYLGWIVATWVTYFTTSANERDTYVLASQLVSDLVQSRWYMLGALFVVVIICFVYILLLRWVVGPVVWISIAGLFGVLGFSLYLCYQQYQYYRDNETVHQMTNAKAVIQSWLAKPNTWLVLLGIIAVILFVLLIMIIFLRSRIVIAIALIKEGSKAVSSIKSTVFFPIFPWLLQCGVIAYGGFVFIYLLSNGDSAFKVVNFKRDGNCECKNLITNEIIYSKDREPCNPGTFSMSCFDKTTRGKCEIAACSFAGIDDPGNVIYLHLVNLLGFFWALAFVSGVADMILASTFATWYWTFKKKDLPFFTLTGGISRVLCYHLGTVAFGSLIIAIVRVIRVILEYIDHKVKKYDNSFTRCVMCCCKGLFWCLDNFIKFINKNAYIMCAVHGKSFCRSARDAFSLLMRNIVRVFVLDKVMDFVFFLSKMLISIGVGFAVYYLLKWYEATHYNPLYYNYVPAVILGVATYLVSSIFFNVYAMAVDTLFLCFLEDCERNDGSVEKPYFMSTNLMRILGKKNKRD